MAKPTGFLEYPRQPSPARPPRQRVRDWQPIHLHAPEDHLEQQAARCMDCGIPFCHTGTILGGMASGCPINNLIPEWNDLVYRGQWREAYQRLHRTNNFPEFTGLVCPAPCEAACTLGIIDPPVTIKNIELAIVEHAFTEGWVQPEPPARRTGRHVAVVGSGPAGLACADQLNSAGHHVTVFERANRIGGLLIYGIPNMKLDKCLVERRVALMAQSGIIFLPNTEVGADYPIDQLRRDFDAIILCTGATRPRDLRIEGRSLTGIHFAVDYLTASTKHLLQAAGSVSGPPAACRLPPATDKHVIIIGGGDTGTDCVATAIRQRCRSLVQFEILPQPPLRRAPDNPWPQWPKIYQLDYGQEEAAALWGHDPRRYAVMTKRFIGDEHGHICAVETIDVAWQATNGDRPQLQELAGTKRTWPAQLVLLALGFLGPEKPLLEKLGVAQDERGNIQAPYDRFATNRPGIFAAGDARRGQSLVVWAIHEGRAAARECDRYLMGATSLP